jgi:hypothetical protein
MSVNREKEWQQLLDFSDRMLQRARSGEWDILAVMASERQVALEQFFAEPVEPGDSAVIEEGIHTMNQIDSEITALANDAYGLASEEHDLLSKRQQASRAYTDPGLR